MVTVLAIVGGIVLVLIVLFFGVRMATILKATSISENTIRNIWADLGVRDPMEQDDIALDVLRNNCFADNMQQYRLGLGVIRSLSSDIIKDKTRLTQFKKELLAYGQLMGWTGPLDF